MMVDLASLFRVGILSDDTMILEGQKEQGKLDRDEMVVLLKYIQMWLEGPEDDSDLDDEEEYD
jgi:hypothetical protein